MITIRCVPTLIAEFSHNLTRIGLAIRLVCKWDTCLRAECSTGDSHSIERNTQVSPGKGPGRGGGQDIPRYRSEVQQAMLPNIGANGSVRPHPINVRKVSIWVLRACCPSPWPFCNQEDGYLYLSDLALLDADWTRLPAFLRILARIPRQPWCPNG